MPSLKPKQNDSFAREAAVVVENDAPRLRPVLGSKRSWRHARRAAPRCPQSIVHKDVKPAILVDVDRQAG